MKCEEVIQNLPLLEYGELSFDQEEAIHQHLDQCKSCTVEFARLQALQRALDSAEVIPQPTLLMDCRQRLRTGLAALREAAPARRSGMIGWFRDLMDGGLHLGFSAKPLGAVALVAMGFFGAHIVPSNLGGMRLLQGVSEPIASRVRYVEPNSGGQVQIVVEEVSQRTLSGATQDEKIRHLLMAAAREATDPGLRVESVDLLKSSCSSREVRRALIAALQHDPNPGVRLKALDGLRNSAGEPETRKALAAVLLNDDNPGVRTQAIDLLTQKKEPSMAGVLQEVMRKEDNDYVRLRCQKALHEMKASIDTF